MSSDTTSLLGWSNPELLARLGEVSPEEWVCHIVSRQDEDSGSFLESTFATLFQHDNAIWKVTVTRDRHDLDPNRDVDGAPRESFWINTQRLQPPAAPFLVMDGPLARRQFLILRDITRPILVEEAVQSELAFDDDGSESPAPVDSSDRTTLSALINAIDNHPPSDWKIRFIQHGGPFDYCQHEISTEIDSLRISIGKNLLSKVDELSAAESGLPEYELALRDAQGAVVPHSLNGQEIRQLYAAFRERVAKSRPRKQA